MDITMQEATILPALEMPNINQQPSFNGVEPKYNPDADKSLAPPPMHSHLPLQSGVHTVSNRHQVLLPPNNPQYIHNSAHSRPGLPSHFMPPPQHMFQHLPPNLPGFHQHAMPFPPPHHVDTYHAKLAFAATMSQIINRTSALFSEKTSDAIALDWDTLRMTYEHNATEKTMQYYYDESVKSILDNTEPYLDQIAKVTTGNDADILDAIGMMKGLTDTICKTITTAENVLTGDDADATIDDTNMREAFDSRILTPWCTILARSPTDVKKACVAFLTNACFSSFIDLENAVDKTFCKYLSDDENVMETIRTPDEKRSYENNTIKYANQEQDSILSAQQALQSEMPGIPPMIPLQYSILPPNGFNGMQHNHQISTAPPNFGGPRMIAQMHPVPNQSRVMPAPPRKRRKKTHFQLFRDDGSRRKVQKNPNPRRICSKMWQSDGITRGCGMNNHPRVVCQCWKDLGFAKADLKNGTIKQWLETKYSKIYKF